MIFIEHFLIFAKSNVFVLDSFLEQISEANFPQWQLKKTNL